MKILFFLPSLNMGGMEKVLVALANALSRRGHDITVKTFDPEDDLATDFDSDVKFCYVPPKYRWLKKIPKLRRFFDDGLWETRTTPRALYKYYVGNQKYDVEIAFFRGRSIKTISGSTNPHSIKLAWVHNDFRHCNGIMANFKSMGHVKEAYDKFKAIVAVSNQAKVGFQEIVNTRKPVLTLYNLVPVKQIIEKSLSATSVNKFGLTLVLVGRLASVKGVDRIISAINRLREEHIYINFWVIGDGPERKNLEKAVNEMSLDNVTFFGEQRNPYPYIRQADLLVCASHYEGYNLTVAESLILGTPVLSTRCTGPVEILGDGEYGMIVENSTEGLTDGLRRIASDPALLAHYAAKAAERRPFFDEDRILNQIESLFKGN